MLLQFHRIMLEKKEETQRNGNGILRRKSGKFSDGNYLPTNYDVFAFATPI